jgi:hypothetical protein
MKGKRIWYWVSTGPVVVIALPSGGLADMAHPRAVVDEEE